jgi:hypothetical protein
VHPVGSIRSGSGQSPSPATGQEDATVPRAERKLLDVRNASSEKCLPEERRLLRQAVFIFGS